MSMAGYTKLFSSILASTIWREDDKTRLVWITLLAMAGKNGIAEGSVPGLAHMASVSVPDCEAALTKLKSPDPYSRSQDHQGRRIEDVDGGWMILNHAKYREKLSLDERREYFKLKKREYRKKSTNVHNVQDKSTESTQAEASPAPAPTPSPLKRVHTQFSKPTIEECRAFCVEIGLQASDGDSFFWLKEGKGWKDVKSWKATIRSWKLNGYHTSQKNGQPNISATTFGRQPSVFELKEVIKAKEAQAAELRHKNCSETAMGDEWANPEARSKFIELKRDIKSLNQRIASSFSASSVKS